MSPKTHPKKSKTRLDSTSTTKHGRTREKRKRTGSDLFVEFLFLLLLFLFIFISGALLGYRQTELTSWFGPVGVDMADFLCTWTFGRWGTFALPLIILVILINHLGVGSIKPVKWIAGLLVAGFFAGFGTALVRTLLQLPDVGKFDLTGLGPYKLSELSVEYLRPGGTIVVSLAIIFTATVLLFNLKPTDVVRALFITIPASLWRISQRTLRSREPIAVETPPVVIPPNIERSEKPPKLREKVTEVESSLTETPLSGIAGEAVAAATGSWKLPPLTLLDSPPDDRPEVDPEELEENSRRLEDKLSSLGISAHVLKTNPGPVITRYDLQPAAEVKISRIANIADDIAMALRARGLRILAPIPGEAAVGIEIANQHTQSVFIREAIDSDLFRSNASPLTIALGKDTNGNIYCTDLSSMPHLLIAGATGSGKSVCINVIINSLLYRCDPRDVRLILIDPKKIELSQYSRLVDHHLLTPPGVDEQVITAPENAVKALQSVHLEMDRRYQVLADAGVRSLIEYNNWVETTDIPIEEDEKPPEKLPYIVIIIDELADLMMVVRREAEELIVRLAQMARAVGIHLVVATQRPSVDVVTGLIKANFPARIAFKVAQKVDSRTIIDSIGAQALLGRGDMLFLGAGSSVSVRLHGAFISTDEVERVVEFVHSQPRSATRFELPNVALARLKSSSSGVDSAGRGDTDEFFDEAAKIVVNTEQGSVSVLQRRLRVGYARAARLIDQLEQAGIVGPFDGSKARQVLASPEELREKHGIE